MKVNNEYIIELQHKIDNFNNVLPTDYQEAIYILNAKDTIITKLALLRSFKTFFYFAYIILNNKPPNTNDLLDNIFDSLTRITFGTSDKQNLLITIAPRVGKSTIAQIFCAYSYCVNNASNCIYTSYNKSLGNNAGVVIRSILSSPLGTLFNVRLSDNQYAKDNFKTLNGGVFKASPMGGGITGFGAGLKGDSFGGCLVIDDPNKPVDLRTTAGREKSVDVMINTLKSRLNNASKTPMIVIMQRLDTEDLAGWILENDKDSWNHICLPALNDKEESNFPLSLPTDYLLSLKNSDSQQRRLFYTQYQQEPVSIGGNIINPNWFVRYKEEDIENDFNGYVFATVDTALKANDTSDYTVMCIWAVKYSKVSREGANLYLIQVIRKKMQYNEMLHECISITDNYRNGWKGKPLSYWLIEDTSNGIALRNQLTSNRINCKPVNTGGIDKFSRLLAVLPSIENGRVHIPFNSNFTSDFITECQNFSKEGNHRYDDQVDCLIYAIKHIFGSKTTYRVLK